MRVPDFEVISNSYFKTILALFLTNYLHVLISNHFIALFQYISRPRLKTSSDHCHLVLRWYLLLPKRPELPERLRNTGKDILNTYVDRFWRIMHLIDIIIKLK